MARFREPKAKSKHHFTLACVSNAVLLKEKIHTSLSDGALLQKEGEKILTPPQRRKKKKPSRVHVQPFLWLHANSIPKNICHNFWPELVVLTKSWGT
jgi:hypothetical protein